MDPSYTRLYSEPFEGGTVSYYLTETQISTGEGVYTRFGAMVELSGGERSQVLDIFGTRDRAESFIAKLSRNLVTPVSLLDVVSDEVYAMEFSAVR